MQLWGCLRYQLLRVRSCELYAGVWTISYRADSDIKQEYIIAICDLLLLEPDMADSVEECARYCEL